MREGEPNETGGVLAVECDEIGYRREGGLNETWVLLAVECQCECESTVLLSSSDTLLTPLASG